MLRNIGLLALLSTPALAQSADTATAGQLSQPLPPATFAAPAAPSGGGYNAVLIDNGPFVTHPGGGTGGADASAIETGWNTYGYNTSLAAGARIADDFTVPVGKQWTLSQLTWFTYQTGSTTTSTITSINVRIWSGAPGPFGGATLLAGDTTTNRLTGSVWSNCYRVVTPPGDTLRPPMRASIDMSWAPVLPSGTYWVDVQIAGSLGSGPWSNPTVPHLASDNAQQFFGGVWQNVQDGLTLMGQDMPYKLEGTESGGVVTYCTAKVTSNGCTPSIGSSGTASATAGSGFFVNATQMINNKSCLLFYGSTGQAAIAFQGGTLCVNTPIRRTVGTNTGGNPPPNDCSGAPSFDMNLFAVGGSGGSPAPFLTVPGTVVNCQWWGRDPGFIAPNNTQLSNGLQYQVGP